MAASYQFIGHSREGGNPVRAIWFPAFAGMTDNLGVTDNTGDDG